MVRPHADAGGPRRSFARGRKRGAACDQEPGSQDRRTRPGGRRDGALAARVHSLSGSDQISPCCCSCCACAFSSRIPSASMSLEVTALPVSFRARPAGGAAGRDSVPRPCCRLLGKHESARHAPHAPPMRPPGLHMRVSMKICRCMRASVRIAAG